MEILNSCTALGKYEQMEAQEAGSNFSESISY